MSDIVSRAVRSRMMAGIRGKNTNPEIVLRRALHKEGLRFRLHVKALPGRPDIVFPKYQAVLLVNGCFWHGHKCHLFKWPKTRKKFWRQKILGNRANDRKSVASLAKNGWRIGLVWECAIKGRNRIPIDQIAKTCAKWLNSNHRFLKIVGNSKRSRRE